MKCNHEKTIIFITKTFFKNPDFSCESFVTQKVTSQLRRVEIQEIHQVLLQVRVEMIMAMAMVMVMVVVDVVDIEDIQDIMINM